MGIRHLVLYTAAGLNFLSIVPYMIDIVRHRTKPNVVSWVTWTILTGVGAAAVITEAGFLSGMLPLSASACTLSVVLLGLKFGFANYTKFDIMCQVSALGGLLLWFIFDSPLIALIAVIVIDAIAALPTFIHSWKSPQEETWQTFAVGSFAALLTLLALDGLTFASGSYPIYLSVANGAIAATVVFRRIGKGIDLSRKSSHETLHENI